MTRSRLARKVDLSWARVVPTLNAMRRTRIHSLICGLQRECRLLRNFSALSLRLCVSAVRIGCVLSNRRDAENAEVAPRRFQTYLYLLQKQRRSAVKIGMIVDSLGHSKRILDWLNALL